MVIWKITQGLKKFPYNYLIRKNSESNKLPESEAKKIIFQLASALENLHTLRIIHRDLKLSNILVNEDFQIKLADFGFARYINDESLVTTFCGTPITMAPEILQKGSYDDKCDIWSLGIIIFQIIYGRPPFIPSSSGGLMDLFEQIVKQELSFPELPVISKDLKNLLIGMLQKNKKLRYSLNQFKQHQWLLEEGGKNGFQKNQFFLKSILKEQANVSLVQQNQQQQNQHKVSEDISDQKDNTIEETDKSKDLKYIQFISYELLKVATENVQQQLNKIGQAANFINYIGQLAQNLRPKLNSQFIKFQLTLYLLQGIKLQQISEFIEEQLVQIKKDSLTADLITMQVITPFSKFKNVVQKEIKSIQCILSKNKEKIEELRQTSMSIGDLIFFLIVEILEEINSQFIQKNFKIEFYQKIFQLLQELIVEQPQQKEILLQIRLKSSTDMSIYWNFFKIVKTQQKEIQKLMENIDLKKNVINDSFFNNISIEWLQNNSDQEETVSYTLSEILELKRFYEGQIEQKLVQL